MIWKWPAQVKLQLSLPLPLPSENFTINKEGGSAMDVEVCKFFKLNGLHYEHDF